MRWNPVFRSSRLALAATIAIGSMLAARQSQAQTATATVQGYVTDSGGRPVGDVQISARNVSTGSVRGATTGSNGFFNMSGLQPATYDLKVQRISFQPLARTITLLIGQTQRQDFQLLQANVTLASVTVVATPPASDVHTSEVATNITRDQIQNLPSANRNFLELAKLAPGITQQPIGQDRVDIASGALPAQNMNVFIDGASLKSDIQPAGIAGQDASRGNPFPQSAIQEFRVITQNFKAEYQKAAGAIITSVTRSGGNEWDGNAFVYGQTKSTVLRNAFDAKKPDYNRYQAGLSLGGPIIQDKLHFFGSWEGNYQNRNGTVVPGTAPTGGSAGLPAVSSFAGTFGQPFRENLFFGKLNYDYTQSQTMELSAFVRREYEDRGFGGQTTLQRAEHFVDNSYSVIAKHQYTSGAWLNQLLLNVQNSSWMPQPLSPSLVGQNFFGVIQVGGRDTRQDFNQDRIALRNDVTYSGFQAAGDHVFKFGASYDHLNYHVVKFLNENPFFNYEFNPGNGRDFTQPFEAFIGFGNPDLSAKNNEIGLYAQDDWTIGQRLVLNLGLRWDYESDMVNNGYVTPQQIRDSLSSFVPAKYFTNGSDRKPFYGAFQPRLGFSYDVGGNQSTVFFGGAGLYYDRDVYNDILDEKYRRQYSTYQIRFNRTGPVAGCPNCVMFQPQYLSRAGLLALIASGATGKPDVFLLPNDIKPPKTYQFSGGVRQTMGSYVGSATYTGARGFNNITYIFGNRQPNGNCCIGLPSYNNVLLASPDVKYWYDALQLQIEKPFLAMSRWGGSINYTLARAEKNGGDLFSFDWVTVAASPRHPTERDERHHVVMNGIVRLPWEINASSVITLGSGQAFNIFDGTGSQFVYRPFGGHPDGSFLGVFATKNVDARLQKNFKLSGRQVVGVQVEAFNLLNTTNFGCYDGGTGGAPPNGNPNFRHPFCSAPARQVQFGLTYGY